MQQRYYSIIFLLVFFAAGKLLFAQGTNFRDYIIRKGENLQQKTNKNIFIRVTVDKTSCYVGEPLLVTYKLYTRLGNISTIAKNPPFNGFSVIDIAEPELGNSTKLESFEGRDYYTSVIRKSQLYPLQPGELQLGQAIIESQLRFTKEEYIAQFDEHGKPEFVPGATLATACLDTIAVIGNGPVPITVKPLPEDNKPASFSGAVGNYRIDALLEKDSISTDEVGKLRVLLSGEGNMTLVPAPEVKFPAGIETYEPTVKDGLNRLVVPVSGSKIFDYVFTVAKEGDYTVPPVTFSYFNVDSGRYTTITSRPLTVHIKKGIGQSVSIGTLQHSKPQSFAEKMFHHRWMIVLPVALIILLGLILWLWIDKKTQVKKQAAALQLALASEKESVSIPVNPLQQSERMLVRNEPRLFYEILDKELHSFLAEKLHLSAESISKKTIAEALDKSGAGVAESLAIQQLLDDIAWQLYTPVADEQKMQDYYVEAARLIKLVGLQVN